MTLLGGLARVSSAPSENMMGRILQVLFVLVFSGVFVAATAWANPRASNPESTAPLPASHSSVSLNTSNSSFRYVLPNRNPFLYIANSRSTKEAMNTTGGVTLSAGEKACVDTESSYSNKAIAAFARPEIAASGRKEWETAMDKACQKLAESGSAVAQFTLGDFYETLGAVPKNGDQVAYDKAFAWYRKAAAKDYGPAAYRLGEMYKNGTGVPKDVHTATSWYEKAATEDDVEGIDALADTYFYGEGTEQSYSTAKRWYLKAARNFQSAWAAVQLAHIYSSGLGTKPNYKVADIWWRMAASNGSPDAMFNLGTAYANGDGVTKNGAAAADWYYKSGVAYLAIGDRDEALSALQNIKTLERQYSGTLANGFLGNQLLAKIYGPQRSPAPASQTPSEQGAEISEGTGWSVTGGFIVTNHHVVAGKQTITVVEADGTKMQAVVAADDVQNDLVLLRVTSPAELPPALPIANDPAEVGEQVFTVGYPHPDLMGTDAKLTDGIVNSLTGLGNDPRLYQVSVPLQAGNSGGPLLNMKGAVIGIVAAKLDAAKVFQWTGDLPENVNYAIKVAYLAALLQSVTPLHETPILSVSRESLENLDKRVASSIVMVLAH